jgi:hypothetical protein
MDFVLWRRRLAGDFSDLHAAQRRRRDSGATEALRPAGSLSVCNAPVKIAVRNQNGRKLLQQLRDEAPQALAIARLQVDEFNAGSGCRNVADDGGGLDLAQSDANFQLHGIADG